MRTHRRGLSRLMLSPKMRLLFRIFQNIFPLRPFRMYRRGRAVVSTFRADELLYRRHRRNQTLNGQILPSALQFPSKGDNTGHSVNRSLFSQPKDVLWTDTKRLDG